MISSLFLIASINIKQFIVTNEADSDTKREYVGLEDVTISENKKCVKTINLNNHSHPHIFYIEQINKGDTICINTTERFLSIIFNYWKNFQATTYRTVFDEPTPLNLDQNANLIDSMKRNQYESNHNSEKSNEDKNLLSNTLKSNYNNNKSEMHNVRNSRKNEDSNMKTNEIHNVKNHVRNDDDNEKMNEIHNVKNPKRNDDDNEKMNEIHNVRNSRKNEDSNMKMNEIHNVKNHVRNDDDNEKMNEIHNVKNHVRNDDDNEKMNEIQKNFGLDYEVNNKQLRVNFKKKKKSSKTEKKTNIIKDGPFFESKNQIIGFDFGNSVGSVELTALRNNLRISFGAVVFYKNTNLRIISNHVDDSILLDENADELKELSSKQVVQYFNGLPGEQQYYVDMKGELGKDFLNFRSAEVNANYTGQTAFRREASKNLPEVLTWFTIKTDSKSENEIKYESKVQTEKESTYDDRKNSADDYDQIESKSNQQNEDRNHKITGNTKDSNVKIGKRMIIHAKSDNDTVSEDDNDYVRIKISINEDTIKDNIKESPKMYGRMITNSKRYQTIPAFKYESFSIGAIIGVVVGSVLTIIIVVAIVAFVIYNKKKKHNNSLNNNENANRRNRHKIRIEFPKKINKSEDVIPESNDPETNNLNSASSASSTTKSIMENGSEVLEKKNIKAKKNRKGELENLDIKEEVNDEIISKRNSYL